MWLEVKPIPKKDLKRIVEHQEKKAPKDNTWVSACGYAKKAVVETDLKELDHKFTCGTQGKRVHQITVRITVPEEFVLQAYEGFENQYAETLVEQLISDINGHLENAE